MKNTKITFGQGDQVQELEISGSIYNVNDVALRTAQFSSGCMIVVNKLELRAALLKLITAIDE